jgi:hypothetical protein
MSITTDRSIFLGAHLTREQKEGLKREAERRKVSMSALVSFIIEEWLIVAPQEQLEPVRSNKRFSGPRSRLNILDETEKMIMKEEDVPLPFGVEE